MEISSSYSGSPSKKSSKEESKVAQDEECKLVIEKILGERVVNNSKQYLVKWEGYPHTNNSWIDEESLEDESCLHAYRKGMEELKLFRELIPKKTFIPKSIIDAYRSNKKLYYVVRYEGDNTNYTQKSTELHKIDIMKCIDFLEEKRTFKSRNRLG